MHTICLVAVDNVPLTPGLGATTQLSQKLEDKMISEEIIKIKNQIESSPDKNFWAEIALGELRSKRNVFSRNTITRLADIMERTNENTEDPQYTEFVDKVEEDRDHYENGTYDCTRLANGSVYYGVPHGFEEIDGLIYQSRAGKLQHPMRTKKAKKMKFLPDYPVCKVFKSVIEMVKDFGYQYDEDHDSYGYYINPNGYWDWYAIGGRWPTMFLVPTSCIEYGVGNQECDDADMPPHPDGYKWASMARKKDIQWNVLYKWEKKQATERFYELKNMFEQKSVPDDSCYRITDDGVTHFGEIVYCKGDNLKSHLKKHGYKTSSRYHAGFYAYYNGDNFVTRPYDDFWKKSPFYKKGDCESDRPKKVINEIDDFIDSLPDDTVLVAVDCHN